MPGNDEHIKKDILDQMFWDDRVNASEIQVYVNRGVVTLRGRVSNYTEREAAHRITLAIDRVKSVDNQLTVHYPGQIAIPLNGDVAVHITDMYAWNPDFVDADISVQVTHGEVTLAGSVPSYWQKVNAQEIAGNIMGVVRIVNELAVVPGESVIDSTIARTIIARLEQHPDIPVDRITVMVENGIVTLTGIVPALPVYHAVLDIVKRTNGVIDIRDRIRI